MLFDGEWRNKIREISLSDGEYPAAWKELPDRPQTAYAIGNISLLKEKSLAVVGSRKTPANALKLGEEICKTLSQTFVILTGTADGGDSAAISGALAGSGRVICLLAGGFSSLPQFNLALLDRVVKRGLILSVHPFETPTRVFSYEYRNKLLAKLSCGAVVLGAGEKSGALVTAKYAKIYQKPVFAFPYPPNSASGCGCNGLIKSGGVLTEGAEDILRFYGIEPTVEKKQVLLTQEEERVYRLLQELLSAHASELSQKAEIPPFKIRGILSALEVKGLVVALGGNQFSVV